MFQIFSIAKYVPEVVTIIKKVIEFVKDIKKKTEPIVTGGIEDKVFDPKNSTIEKFLNGKFPFIEGKYRVKYGDKIYEIQTYHLVEEGRWEMTMNGDERRWKLSDETIMSIEWLEIL